MAKFPSEQSDVEKLLVSLTDAQEKVRPIGVILPPRDGIAFPFSLAVALRSNGG